MEEVFVLNETHSAANIFLAQLRDVEQQKDRYKFRNHLKKLGFLLGYELSKTLNYESKEIQSPLAQTAVSLPNKDIVLIAILRAAMPFCDGFLEVFEQASVGFVGAARRPHNKDETISIDLSYAALPDLNQKTVILVDSMLATGKSILASVEQLNHLKTADSVHIASVVAAPEGIALLKDKLPLRTQFWTCALDERLDENFYIIPGLGDAGDLAYGRKA